MVDLISLADSIIAIKGAVTQLYLLAKAVKGAKR